MKVKKINKFVTGDPVTNKFVASYVIGCVNCGQKPTVTVETDNGLMVQVSELCGCCYFGESKCHDPAEWET